MTTFHYIRARAKLCTVKVAADESELVPQYLAAETPPAAVSPFGASAPAAPAPAPAPAPAASSPTASSPAACPAAACLVTACHRTVCSAAARSTDQSCPLDACAAAVPLPGACFVVK